jgi:hypothetical protein
VLGTRSAFSVLFLAPLVYGIYYPQPYLNQILRKLPIAVVDNDLSDLSRRIVETLDASGALSVAVRARTLAEARGFRDRFDVANYREKVEQRGNFGGNAMAALRQQRASASLWR